VGINASLGDKPEEIVLSCQPYLGNLLKSLPVHPSQKIISETDTETLVSLKVVVNYELKQRLLMMADQSVVVSPEHLKTEMLEIISKAQKMYSPGHNLA